MNGTNKRYRYTGKERDEETGLYYHGARYYIPWLARWSAVDPLQGEMPEWSPYNYGFCNPITWTDPTGMAPGDGGDPKQTNLKVIEKTSSTPDRDNTAHQTTVVLPQFSSGALQQAAVAWQAANPQAQQPSALKPAMISQGPERTPAYEKFQKEIKFQKEMEKYREQGKILDPVAHTVGSDPFVQTAAQVVLTGGVTKAVAGLNLLSKAPGYQILIKSTLDVGLQTVANKGDVTKVDIFDAVLSGVANQNTSAILGSAIDIKPFDSDKPLSITGINKPLSSTVIDLGFKTTFGSVGIGGRITSSLNPSLEGVSKELKFTYNILMGIPLNTTGKILRKEVKENTEQ